MTDSNLRIEFTGRNVAVTPALKRHVREQLLHVADAVDDVRDAHVVLAVEKYRHIAEIVMRRRRGTVTGTAWSRDMYRSIQKAVERLETQVRRRRAKVRTKKRRTPAPAADARSAATPAAEEAALEVVEERMDRVKPIAVEEAVLLLEKARRPFVVFRNSATDRVAIAYRRRDGRFGLIEPRR